MKKSSKKSGGNAGGEENKNGNESNSNCEQPFVRSYLDLPASDSPFSPFRAMQLDYEPMGHAPAGIYSDPHYDFHFYYTPRREVEAIERGECGVGFLSPMSYRKALAPLALKCFPTGAWYNVGLAVNQMGNHIVNLLSPEFNRFPFRGFGQSLIFVRFSLIVGMGLRRREREGQQEEAGGEEEEEEEEQQIFAFLWSLFLSLLLSFLFSSLFVYLN